MADALVMVPSLTWGVIPVTATASSPALRRPLRSSVPNAGASGQLNFESRHLVDLDGQVAGGDAKGMATRLLAECP